MQALGFVSRGLWRSFARPRLQGARWEEPRLLGLSLGRLYCGYPHALPMSETEGAPVPSAAALKCSILGKPPSCSLRNAETNSLLFSESIYWRVHMELRDKKWISDTISVKLKCYLFVSCYSFWDFPWIVLPSSGLLCLQMTFGQLSASPHHLGMKLHVLVSSWNVFNQQFPNVLHGFLGSPRPSQGLFSN